MPAPLTVMAYEHSGHTRCAHHVEPGDLVDWKRNGTRGSFKCEVQRVWRSPGGSTLLMVALLSHDGIAIGDKPIKKITGRQILAVYSRDGTRKAPVRQ